jgi:hypothetical protein
MKPTPELIDELYRDKIRAARAMTPDEKLFAGPRLFRLACRVMTDGIRHQHPEATEEQIQEMVRQRLELARRLENGE